MNYNEAVEYILKIPHFTQKNSLEHTKLFLEYLGNPQNNQRIIHVAGTNGKGSVCTYLHALLRASRKEVGLFTSPHLININERIKINEENITEDKFLEIFHKVKKVADQMTINNRSHPTFFEFLFGMAMLAFKEANLAYIILETGLGGRLDATNAIANPLITIITSISMDHINILGDTIEEIATEKAGIIKSCVPLVFNGEEEKSSKVIIEKANEKKAPYVIVTKESYKIREITSKYIAFSSSNEYYEDTLWCLANIGIYQVANAMLALEAMVLIGGWKKKQILQWKEALSKIRYSGRMEEVLPGVYIDGAHNADAVLRFTESLQYVEQPNEGKKIVLFSAMMEKNYEKMIEYLCTNITLDKIYITTIPGSRGEEAEKLAGIFQQYTKVEVAVIPLFKDAWEQANFEKKEEDRLYCLGSLYLVGMIKELLVGEEKNA